jgi:DNA-binding Lrp family transcriptional regulator
LDKLDIRIMKELSRGNVRNTMLLGTNDLRTSFRSMSRSLGVDQGTVRNRIRKLKKSGLIRGWRLEVNPSLLGRKLQCIMLEVPESHDKQDIVGKISSLDDVVLVCNFMGPSLQVLVSSQSDESLEKASRRIIEISGGGQPTWAQRPTSTIRMALKRTDWEIIKTLQQDPWLPYGQLAKMVGVSPKTTRKRIARLVDEGAIQLSVDVNFSALRGFIPASVIVQYSTAARGREVAGRIIDRLGDELFFAELGDPYVGVFAVSMQNVSSLEQIVEWVRNQPGVRSCQPLILLDVIPAHTMKKEEVENTILQMASS